ncbi:hypothetical protein EDC96DRAFT_609953 [Choanephora cucurbitarum]|nr:hypothetical protein EDC96DRAFT_609953 [Choanephora cucurbitarum]
MMMNLPQPIPSTSLSMKRNKKPKPLFGLFRKGREETEAIIPTPSKSQPLGSGLGSSNIPVNSIQQRLNDPSTSPHRPYRNPLFSPQFPPQQQQQRRQRSKSVGRDPSPSISRLLEERENALNKLCGNPPNSASLVDSLPLLSPTYHKTIPPPVPPIPLHHQPQSPNLIEPTSRLAMRKYPSAHDIRKAAKLQQDSIQQVSTERMPTLHKVQPRPPIMTRSRSASTSSPKHKPLPPPVMSPPLLPKQTIRHPIPYDDNDDDDDVPLGFLQSPISRPSSLLSDQDDEDDNDLVPIAALTASPHSPLTNKDKDYQTAADKYKERVKERLHLDEEEKKENDDDDIPISLALLSFKDRMGRKQ